LMKVCCWNIFWIGMLILWNEKRTFFNYQEPFWYKFCFLYCSIRVKGLKTRVMGCPKTIDGDLKSKEVPTSFGFDTACKVIIIILFYFNQNVSISDFPYITW
jgi:hypothetical protein